MPGASTRIVLGGSAADLGSGDPRTLTATIKDAAGNVAVGDSTTDVTFSQSGGAGSVTGLGVVRAASGVASLTVTGNALGAVTIAAQAPLLTLDTRSFQRDEPRIRLLPAQELERDGRPAIVTTFESVTTRARLAVVSARDTYEVLHIERGRA